MARFFTDWLSLIVVTAVDFAVEAFDFVPYAGGCATFVVVGFPPPALHTCVLGRFAQQRWAVAWSSRRWESYFVGLNRKRRQWEIEEGGVRENKPRLLSWFRFRDVLCGPPTSWVPPGVFPSPILRRTRTNRPHPYEKGRGRYSWMSCCCAC